MPDGEFSNGEWSDRYPHDTHTAFVAACSCGWHGTPEHPPTDAGEEAAYDEWQRDHLNPMVRAEASRHTIPANVLLPFLNSLRNAATSDADGTLSDHSRGVFSTIDAVEELLDQLASEGRRSSRVGR
ncbi:hypothetical protein [Actinokineospora sp.]|uniref:hypothetical protein n=1 Tax=Actinokineospora sp. TaxID=1872133 RepID=UPI003D6AF00A